MSDEEKRFLNIDFRLTVERLQCEKKELEFKLSSGISLIKLFFFVADALYK